MTKIDGRSTRPQLLEAALRLAESDRELLASGISAASLGRRLGITREAARERIRKARRRQAKLLEMGLGASPNPPDAVDSGDVAEVKSGPDIG